MIDVFPAPELTVNYIFADSQGNRQSLHPAESLESKEPQVFDESDPVVAKKILEQIKAKTVKVSKGDKALLDETVARAKPEAKAESGGEVSGKAIKRAVDEAVAEVHADYEGHFSPEDNQAAIDAAVSEAKIGAKGKDIKKAVKEAVAEAVAAYDGFVSPSDHQAALDAVAVKSDVREPTPEETEEPPKE